MLKNEFNQRGYTAWNDIEGRGSVNGDPHEGSHAWPTMNNAILTVVEDQKVAPIMERLAAIDKSTPALGLRAFVWAVEMVY